MVVDQGGSTLKDATDTVKAGREGLFGKKRDERTGAAFRVLEASPMSLLTEMLSQQLVRPVIDKTGLTGKYDFPLRWIPDGSGWIVPLPSDLSIFTAVQEDLGLKLQSAKGPVDVLIIDHAEKPNAN